MSRGQARPPPLARFPLAAAVQGASSSEEGEGEGTSIRTPCFGSKLRLRLCVFRTSLDVERVAALLVTITISGRRGALALALPLFFSLG